MARTRKSDYVSNTPTGTRTVTLELHQSDWETLINCIAVRRIYFDQRRGDARKYEDHRSVEHYEQLTRSLGVILASLYQQVDASYYANQIQSLKEGG